MKTRNSKSNLQTRAKRKMLKRKKMSWIKILTLKFSFLILNLLKISTTSKSWLANHQSLKQTWIEFPILKNWKPSTMMLNINKICKIWCKWACWTLIRIFKLWCNSRTICKMLLIIFSNNNEKKIDQITN